MKGLLFLLFIPTILFSQIRQVTFNGQIINVSKEGNIIDGKMEGYFKNYFLDTLSSEGNFNKGKRNGWWKFYEYGKLYDEIRL